MQVVLGGNGIYLGGVYSPTPAVDPDAQAFITAASITNPTQQSAINQLVVDLKGYGVWSKMKALYPFIGGTSSSNSYNLKNTAQYQITWFGGLTHNANGVTGNGTNGYGDTFLNNDVMGLADVHISIYTPATATVFGSVIGSWNNSFGSNIYSKQNPSARINTHGSTVSFSPFDAGFILVKRPNTTQILIQRNNSITTHSLSFNSYINTSFKLLRTGNFNGEYTNENLRFASIGDNLTDTESTNFYTAVQAFQTTIGRSIGTQTVSDADAQAFVTNAGIVDQVEANAVNNLVIGLKADGLWSKMKAIYPFVGGTSTSTSYNLKNTAQFQITWNGGVTHSSTGVTFNGTNGYGNTGLNPSSALTLNNTHLSFYSRTNGSLGIDLGATSTGDTSSLFIAQNYFSNFYADSYSGTSRFMLPFQTSGLLAISRSASNSFKAFKNATQIGSTITSTSGILPNWNLFLGATNLNGATNPSAYSARNIAFATIGDGLSDSEVVNLNSRVTTFNTTLNRQV